MTYREFEQRYEYQGQIGAGGESVVYKAYDRTRHKEVVIKEARYNPDDENYSLLREFEMAKKLVHSNVAYYVEGYRIVFPREGTKDVVVMEYYSEGHLGAVLKRAKLTAAQKHQLIVALVAGMAYLHAQNPIIIHKDLKPANVLMLVKGDTYIPLITDFGISRQAGNVDQSYVTNTSLAGTRLYAAPEQWHDLALRPSADMWSLGLLAGEIWLDGCFPFAHEGLNLNSIRGQLALDKKYQEFAVVESYHGLPLMWRQFIEKCLVYNPEQRFKTAVDAQLWIQKNILSDLAVPDFEKISVRLDKKTAKSSLKEFKNSDEWHRYVPEEFREISKGIYSIDGDDIGGITQFVRPNDVNVGPFNVIETRGRKYFLSKGHGYNEYSTTIIADFTRSFAEIAHIHKNYPSARIISRTGALSYLFLSKPRKNNIHIIIEENTICITSFYFENNYIIVNSNFEAWGHDDLFLYDWISSLVGKLKKYLKEESRILIDNFDWEKRESAFELEKELKEAYKNVEIIHYDSPNVSSLGYISSGFNSYYHLIDASCWSWLVNAKSPQNNYGDYICIEAGQAIPFKITKTIFAYEPILYTEISMDVEYTQMPIVKKNNFSGKDIIPNNGKYEFEVSMEINEQGVFQMQIKTNRTRKKYNYFFEEIPL